MASISISYSKDIEIECTMDKIVFKKNSKWIQEYIIPNEYEIKEHDEKENNIILSFKTTKKTIEIPKNYSDIKLDYTGLYYVSMYDVKKRKDLYYIDTSLIDKDKFQLLAQLWNIYQIKIPDSFWIANNYRDYSGWSNLKESIQYANNYDKDNKSDFITLEELFCVFYEILFSCTEIYEDLKKNLFLGTLKKEDIQVSRLHIYFENWFYPAKVNKNKYYKFQFLLDNHKYLCEKLNENDNKKESLYVIPVIHQRKLSK